MGGIGSAISSAFTPAGTNARESQVNQQHQAGGLLLGGMQGLAPYLQNQQNYFNSQLPGMQNAVSQLGNLTTQGGRDQQSNYMLHNLQGQAQNATAQGLAQFAGNPALQQGYALSNMNSANQQAGQYAQQLNSPQGMQQALQAYLGGMGSLGAAQPNYGGLAQLASGINGQSPVQVGQSPLTSLLGLAGSAVGAGGSAGSLFGVGSSGYSGGGQQYSQPIGPINPNSLATFLSMGGGMF
jgi:hypothetical protein